MAKPRPFYGELSSASDVSLPDWLQPIGRVVVTGKAEYMEWKITLAHVQITCLLLRTQLSAPSYNGKCEGGSQHSKKI